MPTIKIVSTTVFKFHELSDDAKEKAMDWYRQEFDFRFYQECALDAATHIASLFGLDISNIYYSGFSSQGDGACFVGNYRYVKGALKTVKEYAPLDKELHKIVENLQDSQRRNFYRLIANTENSRGNNMRVNVEDSENPYKDLQGYGNAVEAELESFAHWIYKNLEREYDFQNSEEQVIENIDANEYDFKEDGSIYN